MDESEAIAKSITQLAEAMEQVAREIKEFRHNMRDEWLKVLIQGKVTNEGKIRYDT